MAAAWSCPTRIFRIIASSSPTTPPGKMRRTTAPLDAFVQSSPICASILYQADPSGARGAIWMTVGPAAAARAAGSARTQNAKTAAAALLQKELIHPPFQPRRPALRREIGLPVFRRFPARVERDRPVQKVEKLPPVL